MMASNFVKVNTVIKRLEDEKRTKSPNTLKQFAAKLPTNCLSVFGHFVNLALNSFIILFFFMAEHDLQLTTLNVISVIKMTIAKEKNY